MDLTLWLPNVITQLVVLVVGLPTLILRIVEMKNDYKLKELESSKEETQKNVVIEMIKNGLIKIDPPDAEKLIVNLLSGAIDADSAIKQLAQNKVSEVKQ